MIDANLRELYSKRSPTFLISILPLVSSTVLILKYPQNSIEKPYFACTLTSTIHHFQIAVLVLNALQLFLRTIILAIVHKLDRSKTTTVSSIFFYSFLVGHIVLWIYSVILYFGDEFRFGCLEYQPHYFFIKAYTLIYTAIIIGSAVILLFLGIIAVMVTAVKWKSNSKKSESNTYQFES